MDASAATAARVLHWLLEQQSPVSRPAIAQALGLSRPTVFAAVERLESAHLVAAVGVDSGRVGRSASLYAVARTAGLVGAIDIGGSNVRVAVADARGEVLVIDKQPTHRGAPEVILSQASSLLAAALRQVGGKERLSAICMSVPGVVDVDGKTVRFATNLDHPEAVDFATPIQRAFRISVHLENNVNAAAVGELWRGAAQGLGTFAVISIGAGVGAGIVHDGQVVRGAHRAAGEVANLPGEGALRPINPHAHDEAGGIRLLEKAQSAEGWNGALPATVEELFARAEAGEAPAVALVDWECEQVTRIIASVCAVIDPDAVILTGGVGANSTLIQSLRARLQDLALFPPELVESQLGQRASLMGAVRLAADEHREALLRGLRD